jgi:hypothetical protein
MACPFSAGSPLAGRDRGALMLLGSIGSMPDTLRPPSIMVNIGCPKPGKLTGDRGMASLFWSGEERLTLRGAGGKLNAFFPALSRSAGMDASAE